MKEHKQWRFKEQKILAEKYGRKYVSNIYVLPDGSEAEYYLEEASPQVSIVAFTKDNKVILERYYRPGPDKVLTELPAGGVEKGEDVAAAAIRELCEETGYVGDAVVVASTYDGAYTTTLRYCVVIQNCIKTQEPTFEESEMKENIEVILMPVEEFREVLKKGQMTGVGAAYLGLDYLGLLA